MHRIVAGFVLAGLACTEGPSSVRAPPEPDAPDAAPGADGGTTDADDLWPPIPAGQTSCHLRLRSREVCHVPGWVRAPGIGPSITSLAAFAEDEIWGVDSIGALLLWDGSAFSGGLRDDGRVYTSVWGRSRDDVWMVGERGLVSHWDGATLVDVDVPTTQNVARVHGSAADDVWLVAGGIPLHWNGRRFDERPLPDRNRQVSDVVAFAPNDAWVVTAENVVSANPGPNVYRWSRAEWIPVAGEVEGEVCSSTQPACYPATFPVSGRQIVGSSAHALWVGSGYGGGFFRMGETWTRPFAGLTRLGFVLASARQGDDVVVATEYGDFAGGSMSRSLLRMGPTGSSLVPAPHVTALADLGRGRLVAGVGAGLGWFANGSWTLPPEVDMGWERPPRAFAPYVNPYDGTHSVALVRSAGRWIPAWVGPEGVDVDSDGGDGAWVDGAAPHLLHVTASGARSGPVPPVCAYRQLSALPGESLFLLCGFHDSASQGYVLERGGWRREELPFEFLAALRSNARGTVLVLARDRSLHLRGNGWADVTAPPSLVGGLHLTDDDRIVNVELDWPRAWLWGGAAWSALDLPEKCSGVSGTSLDDLVFRGHSPWHWDGRAFQRARFDRFEYVAGEWVGIDRGALLQRRGP